MIKYEITNITSNLRRIRALRNIPRHNVKAGDLGGFVESEDNLSQKGDAWVTDEARVYEDARVYNEAKVSGKAWVFGNASVYGEARVFESQTKYVKFVVFPVLSW